MREETAAEHQFNLRMMGFFVFVALLPIWGLFAHFNMANNGLAVVCVIGVFIAVAYARRQSLKHPTFLLALLALFVVHIAAALMIRLPDTFHGAVIAPIAFADLFAVLWIMSRIEKEPVA